MPRARFRSIRDWQTAGVTLKVEIATDGELVLGGSQIDFPLKPGGPNGVPLGWAPTVVGQTSPDFTKYTFTTTGDVFSTSAASTPTQDHQAGALVNFPIVPGRRYQIIGQARKLAGKQPTIRTLAMYRSDGGAFTYMGGSQSQPALDDWEDINATSNVVPAGYTMGQIQAYASDAAGVFTLWGAQFQNIYVRELDNAPEPITWRDVTCDVRSIGIRYGRERFTNRYDVATLQVDLRNDDGQYTYAHFHPFGLRPGRQVRVTASHAGVDYPQAFCIIDSITEAYSLDGHVITQMQCTDPTTVLSDKDIATGPAPQTTSGQRIALALDQVGYAQRLLDAGQWVTQRIVASGRSVRDEVGLTADSEGGQFFADRSGNLVYKDRAWPATDPNLTTVTADLVGFPHEGALPPVDDVPTQAGAPMICIRSLNTDWSLARVINIVSLANAGGTAQTFTDEDSVKAHGPHTYERMDFVLTDDAHLATRAADMMDGYADSVLRVNSVAYAPGISGAWPFTLGVFLNWLVRVWYAHPINLWGYAVCVHVQSVEHRITPNDWETTFSVDVPESFVETIWSTTGGGWDQGKWDVNKWDELSTAVRTKDET